MKVVLKNEAGETIESSETNMIQAAMFCAEHSEYGITLYPENNEPELDAEEWQENLDFAIAMWI